MDRAALCYFKQPLLLSFIEVAGQFDLTIDAIEQPGPGFAVAAILGVNAVMLKPNRDALKIDVFPLRIQPQRHRCAGSQARQ